MSNYYDPSEPNEFRFFYKKYKKEKLEKKEEILREAMESLVREKKKKELNSRAAVSSHEPQRSSLNYGNTALDVGATKAKLAAALAKFNNPDVSSTADHPKPALNLNNKESAEEAYQRRLQLSMKAQETADVAYQRRLQMSMQDTTIQSAGHEQHFDIPATSKASTTILLEGCVKKLDMNEKEKEQLQKEIVRQCMKYGNVISYFLTESDGSIVITYKTPEMAAKAQSKLDQRTFDGSQISCTLI